MWPRLAVAFVVLLGGLIAAGLVLTRVADDSAIVETDLAVEEELAENRTDALDTFTEGSNWLAETVPVAVILLVAIAATWRLSGVAVVPVFIALAVGGEKLIYLLTSLAVDRERPPVETVGETQADTSFPSGHTASAITLYVGLALVLTLSRSVMARRLLIVVAAVIVALVGFARLYRGFHYPTDVAAGIVLGVGWLAVVHRSLLGRGRPDAGLDRSPEAEQSAAERDRAEREPRPPDGQPGEHVGEPMDAEQHP